MVLVGFSGFIGLLAGGFGGAILGAARVVRCGSCLKSSR
jgi:hypothetical protein